MTVEQLIEELKKMPPQALVQPIKVARRYEPKEIVAISWQGNYTAVEVE